MTNMLMLNCRDNLFKARKTNSTDRDNHGQMLSNGKMLDCMKETDLYIKQDSVMWNGKSQRKTAGKPDATNRCQ